MKFSTLILRLAIIAIALVSFPACEQQSAAVTAPKYYKAEQAKREAAAERDAAATNPPTYFGDSN